MDRIVVVNKSVAKVYVKSAPTDAGQSEAAPTEGYAVDGFDKRNTSCKFCFNIASVETFEDKLVEAQEALGIHPRDYIPVIYESEKNWNPELLSLALLLLPLLLIAKSGLGAVGKDGKGIFSFGKAKITKMDKNSKNKVSIRASSPLLR